MHIRFKYFIVIFTILLSSCDKPPLVKSEQVKRADIESIVTSVNSGIVKSEKVAELAFGAVGRVRSLNVELGDIVEKDSIIAEIENEDMKSTLTTAKRELERQQGLLLKGLSSKSQIDHAQSNMEMAQGAYDKTFIRAPFKGLIAELHLEVGQLSQITTEFSQALVRLIDLDPRYIRAEIDEVDMPRVKVGQPARVKILAIRKEPFNAVVRKVVPFISSIREQDRTAEIELDILTDQILTVGASGDIEIIVDQKKSVLAVPIRAIINSSGTHFVYTLNGTRAKKTKVELGASNYEKTEIKSGLNENDIVLIQADNVEIEDNMKVSVGK